MLPNQATAGVRPSFLEFVEVALIEIIVSALRCRLVGFVTLSNTKVWKNYLAAFTVISPL
jgi:hypothetical protein